MVAFDRIAIFVPKFQSLIQLKPYLVCSIITIFCFGINVPIFLSYYIKTDDELINDIKYNLTKFGYNGRTDFFYSRLGTIITYIQIIIRDILTLIIEIIISSIALIYFRKFNTAQIERYFRSNFIFSLQRKEILMKKYNRDRQLLLMNLIQNLISIISHLFICFSYITGSQGIPVNTFNWICIAYFCVCFKHFSNFFIFYFFNSNFKKRVKRLTIYKK